MNDFAEIAPQSIKLLCNNIIDYAGTFPPASLDLRSSFLNYCKYLDSNEKWMLSKFIVPAKKLNELAVIIENEKQTLKGKIQLSILGGSNVVLKDFFDNLKIDINNISAFLSKYGSDLIADTYEVRIPLELFVIPNKLKLVEFLTRVSS